MRLPTIVEEYIVAAIKHAVAEFSDDGTVSAYVSEFPGVVAFGADVHECARNLYAHLEEWARTAVTHGYPLPVLDGIDPTTDTSGVLASYQPSSELARVQGDFFKNEAALEEAFRHFDEIAALTVYDAAESGRGPVEPPFPATTAG